MLFKFELGQPVVDIYTKQVGVVTSRTEYHYIDSPTYTVVFPSNPIDISFVENRLQALGEENV